MVICLERGADLHMAQLIPLSLTVSCFSKIQIGFTFLVPAYPGSLRNRAVKRTYYVRACVCVCVCVCLFLMSERRYAVTTFTERLHDSLDYIVGSSSMQMDCSRNDIIKFLVNTSQGNIKKLVLFSAESTVEKPTESETAT